MTLEIADPWRDGGVAVSPAGSASAAETPGGRAGGRWFRRAVTGLWHQPLVGVIPADGTGDPGIPARIGRFVDAATGQLRPMAMRRLDLPTPTYAGEFRAWRSGQLYMTVNDVAIRSPCRRVGPWPPCADPSLGGPTDEGYRDNAGSAKVILERIE
jgi:hypothetical protein